MSRTRRGAAHILALLALTTVAATLATGTASADDRLDIVGATTTSDRVDVTVRYRCDPLMGTDTLGIALADTSDGGIYSATATPVCDNKLHRTTVSAARNAGPAAAADTDAVITASLGISPDPHLFPTASTQATLSLKRQA
ncbi:hypothetical protein ACIREE_25760 [Streptomyces sp. NPDC102467]|uniref:hypothetical protein n=1 Tax=Streptomyces sp. NPDC102467 TaxID=3366179 RepID=UPI00381B15EC